MHAVVSIVGTLSCLAAGWLLGRTKGRPVAGLIWGLFGPLGLLLFWAGRARRLSRREQQPAPVAAHL